MTVNFNPAQGAVTPQPINNLGFDPTKPAEISANSVLANPTKSDKFAPIAASETKSEKKGPIKSIKDFVRAVKKFGITVSEYTKGTFKGVFQGAIVGSVIYASGSAYKHFKKASKLPVKALSVVGAVGTLFANYWKTSLNANEKKADIDHRWTTTKIVDKK